MGTETNDTQDPMDAHQAAADRRYEPEKQPTPAPGSKLHTWTPARAVWDGGKDELFEVAGMSGSAVQAMRDTFDDIERKTGMPDGLSGTIASALKTAMLASTHVPDDAEADEIEQIRRIEEGNRESRERLSSLYGKAEAADLVARSHAFVKSHPALARFFKEHNLGSKPEVVLPLVDFVRTSGWGRKASR
jgi:hypothetical protein